MLVTGYKVYRGTQEIASLGAVTSFSDTGRPPGTYSYTVKATDAAGNLSDASNAASATVPDSSDPTAPTELGATAVSSTRIDLSWQASSDDVGVTGYRIYRGGGQIATIGATTSYSDTTVTAGNTYSYEVRALDGAGHVSGPSNTATATTPAPTQVLTISPEADARVQQSAPTTNYATSNLRTVGDASAAVESFLRFTVAGATGSVRSAKLRVFNYNGTVDGPAVYTTGNSWSETTVNWNTRPARTSGSTDDKGAIAVNTWVEYDVTSVRDRQRHLQLQPRRPLDRRDRLPLTRIRHRPAPAGGQRPARPTPRSRPPRPTSRGRRPRRRASTSAGRPRPTTSE